MLFYLETQRCGLCIGQAHEDLLLSIVYVNTVQRPASSSSSNWSMLEPSVVHDTCVQLAHCMRAVKGLTCMLLQTRVLPASHVMTPPVANKQPSAHSSQSVVVLRTVHSKEATFNSLTKWQTSDSAAANSFLAEW
jgi:hypothetical protein